MHAHAHEHDRGLAGLMRYLRLLPRMWSSEVAREVVRSLDLGPDERAVAWDPT